jgi:hypothetical protein
MHARGLTSIESLRLERMEEESLRLAGTLSSIGAEAEMELTKYLDAVHAEIVRAKRAAFTVDVRRLSFVDSSSIRVFVNWISRAKQHGYKLVFHIDRAITWHRLSFSVLKSLEPDVVEIVESNSRALRDGRGAT